MIRVIINADDLGKDAVVNAAIADALQKKRITSSTIMANSSTWEQVHKIVDANPQASFGVHLNLTEGRAMTDSPVLRKYGIVDNENCFTKRIQKLNSFPEELKNAVLQEWSAQVEKVKIIEGIPVSHVDGHHHVHTLPELVECLRSLLLIYGIQRVRRNYKLPEPLYSRINEAFSLVLHCKLNKLLWCAKLRRVVNTTDYFTSYELACYTIEKGVVIPNNCTIELMCHPGHKKYQKEIDLILSSFFQEKVGGVALVSYKEI